MSDSFQANLTSTAYSRTVVFNLGVATPKGWWTISGGVASRWFM